MPLSFCWQMRWMNKSRGAVAGWKGGGRKRETPMDERERKGGRRRKVAKKIQLERMKEKKGVGEMEIKWAE